VPPAWAACIHESGHAVAALALGQQIVAIWVDGEEGECRLRYRRGQHTATDHAIICLAGTVSEWRLEHPGETPSPDLMRENLHIDDVRDAAERLGTDDPAALLEVWLEAEALLSIHWDVVMSIADSLRWHGSLSGGEAEMHWRGAQRAA